MKEFVTKRLEAFRDRSRMWGSREAVELQAILLLECELAATQPDRLITDPRLVINTYHPLVAPGPLHMRQLSDEHFGRALFNACQQVRKEFGVAG